MSETETVYIDRELEYLVPDYLANRRKDVEQIGEAIGKHDYESIRVMGHNMKGSGAGYGFEAITRFGSAIEEAAKTGNARSVERLTGDLRNYLEKVKVAYR